MMSKWADYGISAVRYDEEHTHIVKVKVHEDKGDAIGSATERSRQDVVADINKGLTFVTIVKTADGKWANGEDVIVVRINGTDFIKTESNNTECDNLESLPEF